MKNQTLLHRLAVAMLAAVLLAGCSGLSGSKQEKTTFYSLASARDLSPIMTVGKTMIVGVGPVYLPDYLNRPQIVTFTSAYELDLSEFNRWGGSLDSDMNRILTQNLSRLLPAMRIVSLPVRITASPDLQVALQVLSFERTASGEVILNVSWGVLGEDGRKAMALRETTFRVQPADTSYEAIVAAMSETLAGLSIEIAEEIAKHTGP